MKSFFVLLLLLYIQSVNAADKFVVGYNQAWFGEKYRYDLTTQFNAKMVDETFRGLKAAGGDVVRQWIWKGPHQGVNYQSGGHVPSAVDSKFLKNINFVNQTARKYGLRIYWTFFDNYGTPIVGKEKNDYERLIVKRHISMLNNYDSARDRFKEKILSPVLAEFAKTPDAIYAIDLMNEHEAAVERGYSPGGKYDGVHEFARDFISYIHSKLKGVRVGISILYQNVQNMWHLPVDFIDVHAYSDVEKVFGYTNWCALVKNKNIPLFLGEYGQLKPDVDDALQSKLVDDHISGALKNCFAGALAWRYDDERPSNPFFVPNYSFLRNKKYRPAVGRVQWWQSRNLTTPFAF